MPDYKKKKRNKILAPPKATKNPKKQNDNDIKMSSEQKKQYQKTNNIRVIEGRKLEKKRKFKSWASVVGIVLVIVLILQSILPAGILVSVKNAVTMLGSGSYPITLSGSKTVVAVSRGNYYYVLSNTHLTAFSNSGKELFDYEHGFENPVLKTGAGGALVYDQGGKELLLFDLKGFKNSIKTEKSILTANISNSGYFAVATDSDKYASAVTVYKNNGKSVYEWYSAEDTVNAVALSKNGKKLAVAVFNSKNGEFVSKVNVLNFKSATPEYTETFEKTLIYNLDSAFSSYFSVITENKIKVIRWGSYKSKEYKSDYSLSVFKPYSSGYVAVFNRQSDRNDNKIAVFSKNGKLKYQVDYIGIISDIDVKGNHIYCMGNTQISMVSKDSKLVQKADFGFGAVNISAITTNSVLVITDNNIEKIKLSKE